MAFMNCVRNTEVNYSSAVSCYCTKSLHIAYRTLDNVVCIYTLNKLAFLNNRVPHLPELGRHQEVVEQPRRRLHCRGVDAWVCAFQAPNSLIAEHTSIALVTLKHRRLSVSPPYSCTPEYSACIETTVNNRLACALRCIRP